MHVYDCACVCLWVCSCIPCNTTVNIALSPFPCARMDMYAMIEFHAISRVSYSFLESSFQMLL